MIQAYKKFWKGYVDFHGVTSCKDYWLAVLAGYIVSFIFSLMGRVVAMNAVISIYALAVFLPSLAIMVRRLRDAGQSWANVFWMLLPVVGLIILIVKLCKPTVDGPGTHTVSSQYTSGAPVYRTYQQPTASPDTATAAASPDATAATASPDTEQPRLS